RLFGYDNVAVLDGGWQKWIREARRVETGEGVRPRPRAFHASRREQFLASRSDVAESLKSGAACVLSGRLPSHFAGIDGNSYGRPGRIAGSVNAPAARLYDASTNTLLPADELALMFSDIDARRRRVIAYCGYGIAASADVFALAMLGHDNVALYD